MIFVAHQQSLTICPEELLKAHKANGAVVCEAYDWLAGRYERGRHCHSIDEQRRRKLNMIK